MEVLPALLSECHPKDIFNADEWVDFQPTPRQNMLSKVAAVMWAEGVKIDVFCSYMQMWMDLRRCNCW
jgi:hypothetical protein